jgi:nucleotidyltransferase substrate binding protein (TIGR01987 family)
MIILDEINIGPFLKAKNKFDEFIKHLDSEQEKAGAIQAFEFCYELSWKLLKRVLKKKGIDVASPRDTFREAARNKLIDDPEIWFQFQHNRNLTTHTYNENYVDEIVKSFPQFQCELDLLVQRLQILQ